MKFFKLFLISSVIFLLSACATPVINQNNNSSSPQITDPKIKCENSGGKWMNLCETGECFKCYCDEYEKDANSRTQLIGSKLLINGECIACTDDEQCGKSSECSEGRFTCAEKIRWCEAGLCKFKYSHFGQTNQPKTYECKDNHCVPISQ